MWKKDETPEPITYTRPEPAVGPVRAAAPLDATPAPTTTSSSRATIGSSITIRGDVTGEEDLLIQGRVDGSVDLKQNSVTVGREGQVKANITGRVIAVEGRVEGNLKADEQVILRSSAVVQGDITAPRVVLEDGARFRGGIDMGELPPASAAPQRPATGKGQQSGRGSATAAAESVRAEAATSSHSAVQAKPDGAGHRAAEVTS